MDWTLSEWLLPLLFVIVVAVWRVKRRKSPNFPLPPGPWSPPLVGYLPFLGKEPYKFFYELQKKYGPVFSLYLGRQYVVVLGDFTTIQEAYNKEEFLGRPLDPPNLLVPDTTSFSTRSGDVWKKHRRFAMQSLRDLGFAKIPSEQKIQQEVGYFIQEVDQSNGSPFEVRRLLASSVSNVIMSLVIGRRVDYADPSRLWLDDILKTLARFFKPISVHAYFPWTKKILTALRLGSYGHLADAVHGAQDFMKEELQRHRRTIDRTHPRDYVDMFLAEMDSVNITDLTHHFTEQMLRGNIVSLLTAGTEPVLATLDWIFVTMATFSEVQKRVQEEIDEVIGRDGIPSWAHHLQMPYTEAAIMEVQRWKTTVPINMLRCVQGTTSIEGYTIPKGALVLSNLWAVHHDPRYWPDPEKYVPERFLDDSGTTLKRMEHFIPFSYGKRICPGLSLGKMEVFLYVTSVLQNYTLQLPPGATTDFDKELGVTLNLRSYELCFVPRRTGQ